MKISIENFANINRLDFDLEKNKLNFIYGISGSGKSSIAKALTTPEDELEGYKTFGTHGNVKVDFQHNVEFKIFNDAAVEEYIFAKSGDGIYDIIYGENEELKQLKQRLNLFLQNEEIVDVKNIIRNHIFNIELLEKNLGTKRTGTGKLSKTGIYSSLSNPRKYYDKDDTLDAKQKTWIKKGDDFYDRDICPFCNQVTSLEVAKRIIKIIKELPSDYEKVVQSEKILEGLGIMVDVEKIHESDTQEQLSKDILNYYNILSEMTKIEDALNISLNSDQDLSKKINIKKPSEELIKLFNDSNIDIVNVVNQLKKDTEGYSLLKKEYNGKLKSTIKRNINRINEYISFFGIHYKLQKSDLLSKNNGYILTHKKTDSDTSSFLSTGEKNIVSMILFLLSYEGSHIIIDDPASSFDEYRREQILTFIFENRYKNKSSILTTLILSHDQIFLKFLTKNYMGKDKYKDYIGKIYHFENINGSAKMVPIERVDMQPISIHIQNKLSTINNYTQKLINLRLFYELKDINSIEYSYLSGVLHSKKNGINSTDLLVKLAQRNISEGQILVNIEEQTGVALQVFDNDNIDFKISHISNFEKMCLKREELADGSKDKKILNDVVHFNYALNHLLNPYKFNFQNSKSYEIIQENI